MNKRVLLISLAAAGLYGVIGFFGVPYAIKNIAPQKVAEATEGGKFSVESASFNPFTFHLSLKKMVFKTPQNGDLIAIEQFSININPLAYLWRGGWVIKDITLIESKAAIHRDANGDFNFKWLTQLGDQEEPKEKPEPLKLLIERFTLKEGSLEYRDASEGRSYALDAGPIGFSLENIDLRDLSASKGAMRLYATINDGGFVDLRGKIDTLSPLAVGGKVAFDSGKLYTPWRYFKEKFPIEVADGKAKFGFDYRFDSNDINATELSNLTFDIEKLRIIPKGEKRNLLSMGELHVREGKVLPMSKLFSAGSLNIAGVNFAARRSQEGIIDWLKYVEEIQKAFPEDENETKVPWNFRVEKFVLDGLGVEWSDNAPAEPYRLSLANGRVHAEVIASDPKVPLSVSAATDALRIVRQKDEALVANAGALGIEGITIEREGKFASVSKVSIDAPSIELKRLKGGKIDLTCYLYASAPTKDSAEASPWGYRVDEVALNGGVVGFVDEVPSKKVALTLNQLSLSVRDFSSDPKLANHIAASALINGESSLRIDADLVRENLRSKGRFELKGLDVTTFDPYLEPATYAALHRGHISVAGDYDYRAAGATVKGKVALNDWVIDDSRDESVLVGWENIGATPFGYAYPDNRLKINQLAVDGLYANALIDAKKIFNFSTLSKGSPKDANTTKSSGNPFGIDIVKLLVRQSSANFSDLSLPLPFKTYIHDLEGSVLGISTTKDVMTFVKLRGGVDQYGLAKIDGQLNTKAPKQFTDMKVAFDNLELKQYTPYSLQFLGYEIDNGKLFLNLGYKIDNGKLLGDNKVLIKQIELGKEKAGGSPWPMRLVVALLEDSSGVIDLDLPIEGDVNKPDFKYGKVVWQVIKNLFTKAVTSPFRLLSSMLGIESDKLSNIEFEGGSAALLPPEQEKLDQIAAMFTKRPKLSLEVYGASDSVNDVHALKAHKLVEEALKRDKKLKIDSPQAMSLDLLEDMADDAIGKKERKAIAKRLEEQHKEEAAFVRYYSAELIERLIAVQTVSAEELQALSSRRAEQIRQYLAKNPVFEKRIVVKPNETAKATKEGEIPVRMGVVVP